MLICELELLASTFALAAFAPYLGRWVVSFTDNTVAQAAMRRQRARSPAMQAVVRRRTLWMHERGMVEVARRITSEANVWADVGSRPELGGWRAVRQMALAAGLQFQLVAVPAEWRATESLRAPDPCW